MAIAGGGTASAGAAVAAGAVATAALQGLAIGAVVSAGIVGANLLFSKHNPGMSSKAPVSWTNIDEGIQALKNAKGDAVKAAEQLMDLRYGPGNWKKGAGTEFNALHKWLNRIIRGRL